MVIGARDKSPTRCMNIGMIKINDFSIGYSCLFYGDCLLVLELKASNYAKFSYVDMSDNI
jgi:hypothetical protein